MEDKKGSGNIFTGAEDFGFGLLYLGRVALEDGGARKKASRTGEETISM